jgi:hypothetical protein|tara:strand:+ start:1396 stop:1662 length:267 start_codon:yes stop_codon:yes gene_type:complete
MVQQRALPNLKERRRLMALKNSEKTREDHSVSNDRQINNPISLLRLSNFDGISVKSSPNLRPKGLALGRPSAACNESMARMKQFELKI